MCCSWNTRMESRLYLLMVLAMGKGEKKKTIELRIRRGGVTSKKFVFIYERDSAELKCFFWRRILTVLVQIHLVHIWPLLPFLCHPQNNSWNNMTTRSTNQSFWPDSGQILRHQYGISDAKAQTFLLAKCPKRRGARRNGSFRRLHFIHEITTKDYEVIGVNTGVNAFPHKIMRFPRILFMM